MGQSFIPVIEESATVAGIAEDEDVTEEVTDVGTVDDREAEASEGEDTVGDDVLSPVLSLLTSVSGSDVFLPVCDGVGAGAVILCLATTVLYCCISITAASSNT